MWNAFSFTNLLLFCTYVSAIRFLGRERNAGEWAALQGNFTEALRTGRWVDATDDRPMYVKPCRQEGEYFDGFTIGERHYGMCFHAPANQGVRFKWLPAQGPLYAWSPSAMCEALQGRNVLLAGDSLTSELFFSLSSAMLFQASEGDLDAYRHQMNYCNADWFCPYNQPCRGPVDALCPQMTRIHYERLDNLNPATTEAISRRVEAENVSLLVLNAGPHYDPELPAQLRATMQRLYALHPQLSIVWRNTANGHRYCQQTFRNAPSNMRSDADNAALNYTDVLGGDPDKYYWRSVDLQNTELRLILAQEFPQTFWLNVADSTAYRADSHSWDRPMVDCLHYCLPGPTDHWVALLFNALLLITDTRPSPANALKDRLAVLAAAQAHPYAGRDGLILRALHYHSYYLLEGGERRHIRDPAFIRFLDSVHVSPLTLSPSNSSVVLVETIDNDKTFYEIPAGKPLP